MPLTRCRICSKEFYIKPSHQKLGWGKYCSIFCRSKAQFTGKNVECYICHTTLYRPNKKLAHSKSQKYFCSKTCQTIWKNSERIEEKSNRWKNGKNTYRNILLRKDIPYQCKLCGSSDIRILVVHHIDHDRTDNKVDNLIWLCLNCHFLVHHDKKLDILVKQSGGCSSVG